MSHRLRRQDKMSSKFHRVTCGVAFAAMLALGPQSFAQSDDGDPEMRIDQLENQLRQLTGQNEELQHQNQLLQERLRALQGGAGPGGQPNAAAAPPPQPNAGYQPPPQGNQYQG